MKAFAAFLGKIFLHASNTYIRLKIDKNVGIFVLMLHMAVSRWFLSISECPIIWEWGVRWSVCPPFLPPTITVQPGTD